MKKKTTFLIITIILMASIVQNVSATSVFLTSDNVGSEDNDLEMLESIKNYVEEISNGKYEVIIDDQSPSPGEGTRAVEGDYDVCVNFAAVDCGNFQVLAKGSQTQDKQIIFVNTGNLNLENRSYIRRAWDDNYSQINFAGILQPGKFLNDAGIQYIQPLIEYPNKAIDGSYTKSDDEVNKYIAQEIINDIENYSNQSKTYNNNLIITHQLSPSKMALSSKSLINSNDSQMNETYNSYTAPQLLYLTASYLNGSSLEEPNNYEQPESPMKYSLFTKSSYTYYDYVNMASIVQDYMNTNKKAPDYIKYEGAYIGYYDLVYNFAKITQNHTTSSNMDFARSYTFDKVNSSILIDIAPFAVVILAILLVLYAIKKVLRYKYRKRRY